MWKRERHARQAAPHPKIEMIERTSPHANEHIIVANARLGRIRVLQYLWATVRPKEKSFHSFSFKSEQPLF
jgi:hypothetical protein